MGSRILVTGAGGFIGSHLVEHLVSKGHSVRAFVHYNSLGSWGWLENSKVRDAIEVMPGDIRDYDSVEAALQGCSQVYHLAALIGIPYSYISPLAYVRTNVEGTYNVLQGAKKEGLEQVIVTSTSETYGSAQYVPIDEKHPAVGQSPYAATKVGADQLALSFHKSFGLPVKVVRPFNTYGPRQSARAVIPTIMSQLLRDTKEIRLGSLTPTRDLVFVEDTVRAYTAIAECAELTGDSTNISTGEDISIGDLAQLICKVSGRQAKIVSDDERIRPEESEVVRLQGSSDKLRKATGWKPKETLESGLQKTLEWLKENLAIYKSGRYNV